MEDTVYNALRQFADSWGLFAMFLVFMLVLVRTLFRPGSKAIYKDAADITMLRGDNLEDDVKALEKQKNDKPRKEAKT